MKYIYIITILISVALSACDNDLNETVYSEILEDSYVYSEEEIDNVIGPVYTNLNDLFSSGNIRYYMVQQNTSDETVRPANASGWDNAGIWKRMHLHNWTTEEWLLNETWEYLYKGVVHATRIIELLESGRIPIKEGESIETYVAEVKVARAFYHWLIMDNFGDAPLVKETTQELPEKTSRKDLYTFIVDELNQAIPSLNEDNSYGMYGRFNKWAAKALLANVYLNAEVYTGESKWNECIKECNDIIDSEKYLLEPDYRDNFVTNNEGSKENIFAVQFDDVYATGFVLHNFSLHAASKATYELQSSPWGSGGFCAVPQFIDTYDPEDKRLEYTWISGPQYASDGTTPILNSYEKKGEPLVYTKELPDGIYQGENEGYRVGKWEIEMGAASNLSNDFPVFRYAQVLMMKAECLLRTGNNDEAASIVTEVRQRVFDDSNDALVTGSQLLENSSYNYGYVENYQVVDPGNQDAVQYGRFLDELGWEFACETLRRRDMIRFGVFTTKSWLSHKPNGEERTVFPIIQGAINANPKLIQNPDY